MSATEPDRPNSRSNRWGPATTFAALILLASIVPIAGGPSAGSGTIFPFGIGLTVPFHLFGYAVLATLATRGTGRLAAGLVTAAALSTGFGFGIELLQAPIPWRTFAWGDVAVNAVGAVIGAITAGILARVGDRGGADPVTGRHSR